MDKTEYMWDKEQTKMFIALLKQCPCLFDAKDPDFTNHYKRAERYNFILDEIKDFRLNTTVKCIRSKIRTIQSQISKERSKMLKLKEQGIPYKPKLWFYNEVQFLFKVYDTSHTNSNKILPTREINKPIEVEDDEEEQEDVPMENTSSADLSQLLRIQAIETLSVVKNLAQQQQKTESIGKEEEFCRYLCSELKKITSDDTLDDLKIEILQLVRKTVKDEKNRLQGQQHGACKMGEINGWHLPPSR